MMETLHTGDTVELDGMRGIIIEGKLFTAIHVVFDAGLQDKWNMAIEIYRKGRTSFYHFHGFREYEIVRTRVVLTEKSIKSMLLKVRKIKT